MFERILVPLDGSGLAERALQPALRLATAPHHELFLLRVPEAKTMFEPERSGLFDYGLLWPQQALERSAQEAREYLQGVCRQFADRPLRLRILLSEGDPASVIVDTTTPEGIDLIVMSSHGYSGIARWVMGSVADRVVRAARCPVLIVRSEQPIRNVLITLDGSELSERALEPGIELAARLDCPVTLFRSVTDPAMDEGMARQLELLEPGLGERLRQHPYRAVESYLDRLAQAHRRAGSGPKTVVASGSPASRILDHAASYGVDLIVMATHGRSGVNRWVHGSVTEKVLRASGCSMLIVPAGFARRLTVPTHQPVEEHFELARPSLN
jgi:nucleotide-binding universal stress UspA family protein